MVSRLLTHLGTQILETKISTAPETTLDQWDRLHNVNTRGVFMCMREEIRAMLQNKPTAMEEGGPLTRGAILNMGSVASKVAIPGNISYTAAKHVCRMLFTFAAIYSVFAGRQWNDEGCWYVPFSVALRCSQSYIGSWLPRG